MPVATNPITIPAQTYDSIATDLSISVLDNGNVAASGQFRRYRMDGGKRILAPIPPVYSMSTGDAFSGQFVISHSSGLTQEEVRLATLKCMALIDAALQGLSADLGF
jgi:hypothetical protein